MFFPKVDAPAYTNRPPVGVKYVLFSDRVSPNP